MVSAAVAVAERLVGTPAAIAPADGLAGASTAFTAVDRLGGAPAVLAAVEREGPNLLAIVAAIIGVGVIAQVLADRFKVPSVVFLIAAGIALGPEGVGLIERELFGEALSAIVGVSVAIIVFEGAFHLKIQRLKEAPKATLRLVTVGAALALLGTTAVVHYALGATWPVALLVGSLLVATGPTVITPILEVVPVRDRVQAALETEGIVNDVTAAIIAAVVFEAIVEQITEPGAVARLAVSRLGIGMVVGSIAAAVLFYAVRYVDLSPENAPRNARLLVLAGAIVAFGVADTLAPEAGVAAVATAGMILGNLDMPYEENVTEFKGDVTLLVLSFVFITLASLLRFEDLIALGAGGVAVVVAVALVIRPLIVFLSTTGDRFTTNEKLFVSFVGPRGIIPASVATLFAIEFRNMDAGANPLITPESGGILVGTVFLVILATVVFEAGLANRLAKYLNVIPMRVIIVGGGNVGRELAERLENRGENVVMIDDDVEKVENARDAGYVVHHGDGTDTDVLRGAGVENARIVVAATGDDDVNLLVSQLVASKFEVEQVIARVNRPENVDAFEELGVRTISPTFATASAIDNLIERPTLSNWMTELGRTGEVQEVELTTDEFVGMTIEEFAECIPGTVLVALVGRDGDSYVPDGSFTLQHGDRLTFLGNKDDVREAIDRCHPVESDD